MEGLIVIKNRKISIATKQRLDFINITDRIATFVQQSGIKNGFINIFVLHTTAAIIINENEPLLLEDLKEHLESLAPSSREYRHDNFSIRTVNMCLNEPVNGHSHCKAIHLPTNHCLNIIDGQLQLGKWQQIFLIELDRARDRMIQFVAMGE